MTITTTATGGDVPTTYDPLKEVRLAVVIYGGVSLAIYINGIAQEMLALVRATAPRSTDKQERQPLLADDEIAGSSLSAYRKLGQLLGDPDADLEATWAAIQRGAPLPIRTRFVIDVLSGTSAGGINAVFLAKALATNNELKYLEQLWETKGDIEALINDKESLTDRLRPQRPPRSLLNGQRMYQELLDALDMMEADDERLKSPLVDRLELFSTATDIYGLVLPMTLTDGVVYERRHKNVFRFQHISKGPMSRSDFATTDNPFLAYAARCTSAFPFAFEPMALCDIFPILRSAKLHVDKDYCDADTKYWQRYYLDYIGNGNGGGIAQSLAFPLRPFGDGGYLDNKPFTHAIDALLKRHADLPVDRKLIYIEPSPESLRAERPEGERPDAIENSLAALLSLPRYETIRQDLELIVERNSQIERISRVLRQVRNQLKAPESGAVPSDWLKMDEGAFGSGYATYERLKVTSVTDDLADALASAFQIDTKSALGAALRVVANEWRELEGPRPPDRRQFLLDFDVEYRLRRIRHVWREISSAYVDPSIAADLRADYPEELQRIKDELGEPYLRLQLLVEGQIIDPKAVSEPILSGREMHFVAAPPKRFEQWPGLADYTHAMERSDRGRLERAQYLLQRCGGRARLSSIAELIRARFSREFMQCSALARAPLADSPSLSQAAKLARTRIRTTFENFERYDSAAFPITYGTTVGECDHIDIHRISPVDATVLDDVRDGRSKLRGHAVGAFGGFLDKTWRRNDILWGRLDSAERLISMMLPGDDAVRASIRKQLIAEAQQNIVLEFLKKTRGEKDWKEQLRDFVQSVPSDPEPTLVARSAARATAVTGALLEGIADSRRAPGQKIFRRIALVGRFLWQFVEVSTPRAPLELLASYWLQLVLLFGAVLMLAASVGLTGWRFAGLVFSLAVIGSILRHSLRRYLRGDLVLSPPMTMAITGGVAVALAIALHQSPGLISFVSEQGQSFIGKLAAPRTGLNRLAVNAWMNALLRASIVVSVISFGVLAQIHRRFPRRGRAPLLKLQLARRWRDVYGVVGKHDLEARLRAAQAARAHFGFAAAYSGLLASIGLLLALKDPALGAVTALLGVAAGILDGFENNAVLKALQTMHHGPLPDESLGLEHAPFPFAVVKWMALMVAVSVAIFLIVR